MKAWFWNALACAVVVVVVVLVVVQIRQGSFISADTVNKLLGRGGRSKFVSKEASDMATKSKAFFESGAPKTYKEYKKKVPHADPVAFVKTRKMSNTKGGITREMVQKNLFD